MAPPVARRFTFQKLLLHNGLRTVGGVRMDEYAVGTNLDEGDVI
jgi:hypothetical protein